MSDERRARVTRIINRMLPGLLVEEYGENEDHWRELRSTRRIARQLADLIVPPEPPIERARVGDTITVTGTVRTVEMLHPDFHRRITLDLIVPHEFAEDVNDGSMCLCGIPALTHDVVYPPEQEKSDA